MSFEEESRPTLKELVTETLQANGTLERIQAQLRASVFLSLEEECKEKNIPLVNKRSQQLLSTPTGKLALGLVKDFLECLELDLTLTVLIPESQMTTIGNIPDHSSLEASLTVKSGTTETNSRTPVLFKLVSQAQNDDLKLSENGGLQQGKTETTATTLATIDVPVEDFNAEQPKFDQPSSIIEKLKECAIETGSNDIDGKSVTSTTSCEKADVPAVDDVYEDEFSSSTEKESTTKDEESQKDTEAEEQEIEEDLSFNDILSTQSDVSENTKDITISENAKPPKLDYQESI